VTSHKRLEGQAILLEIIVGFLIILGVVLVVGSLFPTSYQGSLQAARSSAALSLARQVLERQKRAFPAVSLPPQAYAGDFVVQGRPVRCEFSYQVEQVSSTGADPVLWQVRVSWENAGKNREMTLVGASAPR
jgi:hypothetical protein